MLIKLMDMDTQVVIKLGDRITRLQLTKEQKAQVANLTGRYKKLHRKRLKG